MDFAINAKAEGRVLVPWEQQFSNLTLQDPSGDVTTMLDDFTPDWQGQGNVWEAYRRTCPSGSPARQLYSSYHDPNIQKANARSWEVHNVQRPSMMIMIFVNTRGPITHRDTFSLIGERFRCSLPYFLPRKQWGLQTSGYLVTTTRERTRAIHMRMTLLLDWSKKSTTWKCLGIRRVISSFGVVPQLEEVARRRGLRQLTNDTDSSVWLTRAPLTT